QRIATGDPTRRATETARLLKRRLNELFNNRFPDWVAYGDFSMVHVLPRFEGARPDNDDFIPYGGALAKLGGPKDAKLLAAWRHGLLLNGVDWFGFGAFVTAAHTEADVDQTVDAVAHTIVALREEGLA